MAWVQLEVKTFEAEKISSPLDWTSEEKAAYEYGSTAEFSRLRGYTEQEIEEFMRSMEATRSMIMEFGEEDVHSMSYEIRHACSTPELELIDGDLISRMYQAQRAQIGPA